MDSLMVSPPLQAGDIGLYQFRAALCKRDCETFDSLMDRINIHSRAAMNATMLKPHEARILSILLEQEKRLERLDQQINQNRSYL
jgi:hypothetical protein